MWFSLERTTSVIAGQGSEAGNPGTLPTARRGRRDDKKERAVVRKGRLLEERVFSNRDDKGEVGIS
jgi:hypothetical protein